MNNLNISLNDIIVHLKKDEIKNANIINFIEENVITDFVKIDRSVLIKGISDKEWIYFSCYTEDELNNLLQKIDKKSVNFAVIEDWMIPILNKYLKIKIELSAIKLILPKEIVIPEIKNQVSSLFIENSDYIYKNYDYKDFTDINYIKERITKGISAGIFDSGKLIAWSITHDDGAIGMLHVLPEYRRKGLAKDITIYIIEQIRKRNKVPFVQIEEKNIASNKLAYSLGFIKDRRVHWIKGMI